MAVCTKYVMKEITGEIGEELDPRFEQGNSQQRSIMIMG